MRLVIGLLWLHTVLLHVLDQCPPFAGPKVALLALVGRVASVDSHMPCEVAAFGGTVAAHAALVGSHASVQQLMSCEVVPVPRSVFALVALKVPLNGMYPHVP